MFYIKHFIETVQKFPDNNQIISKHIINLRYVIYQALFEFVKYN
jgi:hypothetical protein